MSYYRLKSDFTPGHGGDTIAAGTLLFPWRMGSHGNRPGVHLSERPDGQGYSLFVPGELLDRDPKPRCEEFSALFAYMMVGAEIPPHLEVGTDESLQDDLSHIVHTGSLIRHGLASVFGGRIMLPVMRQEHHSRAYGEMAVLFATHTQGGALTGEAYVLIYRSAWVAQLSTVPRTAKFRLCDHSIQAGAGARPERGWHPSRCTKCGLNTSVDSGD